MALIQLTTAMTEQEERATQNSNNQAITANTWTLSGGTEIPSGADLYNYTTVGNYYCNIGSNVNTLLHKPIGLVAAFIMKVYLGVGNEYPTQEIAPIFSAIRYYRIYDPYNKTWADCGSVATSADVSAVNTTIKSKMPISTGDSTQVGYIANIYGTAGSTLSLPSGGTWEFFGCYVEPSTAYRYGYGTAGVATGGSTILASMSGKTPTAFIRRIL